MIDSIQSQKNIITYYSSGLYVFETKEECEEIDNLIAEWDEYAENKGGDYGFDYFFTKDDEIMKNGHPVQCSQSAYICHLMTKETPKQIILLFQDEHYQCLKEMGKEKEIGETSLWKLAVNKISNNLTLYYKDPILKHGEKPVTNPRAYNPAWTKMDIPIEYRNDIVMNGVIALNLMIEIFTYLYEKQNIPYI